MFHTSNSRWRQLITCYLRPFTLVLYSLHRLRPTPSAVSLLCVVSYGDIVRVVFSFTFTFTYTFIQGNLSQFNENVIQREGNVNEANQNLKIFRINVLNFLRLDFRVIKKKTVLQELFISSFIINEDALGILLQDLKDVSTVLYNFF